MTQSTKPQLSHKIPPWERPGSPWKKLADQINPEIKELYALLAEREEERQDFDLRNETARIFQEYQIKSEVTPSLDAAVTKVFGTTRYEPVRWDVYHGNPGAGIEYLERLGIISYFNGKDRSLPSQPRSIISFDTIDRECYHRLFFDHDLNQLCGDVRLSTQFVYEDFDSQILDYKSITKLFERFFLWNGILNDLGFSVSNPKRQPASNMIFDFSYRKEEVSQQDLVHLLAHIHAINKGEVIWGDPEEKFSTVSKKVQS